MDGLLGQVFSAGNVARRKLTDLLGNPVLSAQQIVGNLNDRARVLNEMTSAASREGVNYGPASRQLAGLLAEAYNPIGMMVYHGSPAKFSRFDPTKIGSGEGAQAYGYGHYLAQTPTVAESYAFGLNNKKAAEQLKKLSNSNNIVDKAAAARLFYDDADTLSKFIKSKSPNISNNEIDKIIQESKTKFNDVKQSYGNIYEVDLPDEQIAKMLDWDKPLSQQPDIVKSINPQSLGLTYKKLENGNHAFVNSEGQIIGNLQKGGTQESFTKNWTEDVLRGTGSDLYRQLGQGMEGGPKVSSALRQAGIPGIRYLDQGSRGTGEGTSNFVVFPGGEDLLTILRRNGGLLGP